MKEPLDYTIEGDNLQILRVRLKPGQEVFAEAGRMVFKNPSVAWETKATGGSLGAKIWGMVKRKLSGESLFFTYFRSASGGEVGFSGSYPGRIEGVPLDGGASFLVQRDAFLAAEDSVTFSVALVKKLGAGFFGGEGFIMQKLTGPGLAFVCLDGEIVEYTLEPNQVLKVDTGHVAMYEPTVGFDIEMVRGFKNILFGGEGLFLTTLRGPGRVWLQTMPTMNLAKAIAPYVMSGGSGGGGVATNVIGGLLDQ
jgi:uncharacterized protein (TIGR00266 family)